jgi:hypothetical protein
MLAGSIVCLVGGGGLVLLLARRHLWLLAFPLAAWGALFMTWAYLRLKDPGYYG